MWTRLKTTWIFKIGAMLIDYFLFSFYHFYKYEFSHVQVKSQHMNQNIRTTPKFSSYKNHSVDLHSKSIDWFLYDGNFGVIRYKRENESNKNIQTIKNTKDEKYKRRFAILYKFSLIFFIALHISTC